MGVMVLGIPTRGAAVERFIAVACALAIPALLWRGLISLPHEYDVLAARGVPVPVQVLHCGVGEANAGRNVGCDVRTDWHGHVHSWGVVEDLRAQLRPDGTVGGVVDPLHPDVSALAVDVDHRTGAGLRGIHVFMAALVLVMGLLAAYAGWGNPRRRNPPRG